MRAEQRTEQHRAPKEKGSKPRRSGFAIMKGLIGLVRPLAPVMGLAIVLGVIGYLCAIFLTVIAGYGILGKLQHTGMELPSRIVVLLCVVAVARGILHYGEQYCNHFIAFRLLAIIRHRVFAQLRKLCPAKLEGQDRGDLIAIITSDIELLEVFYAHTISPIAIAILTSIVMVIYIGHFTLAGALCAVCAYLVVGALIPILMGKRGAAAGVAYREKVSEMNSYMLESLYGIDETIRYGNGSERLEGIDRYSRELGERSHLLSRFESMQKGITNLAVLIFSFGMLFLMIWQCEAGNVDFAGGLLSTIAMMGSFGPVIALSNLSNNLNQTLACGERVLSLLEEQPEVEEVPEEAEKPGTNGVESAEKEPETGKPGIHRSAPVFEGASLQHVDFSYEEEQILSDYTLEIEKGKIIGIHGASGSGKSTLLKLLMRFWDADHGQIRISGRDIRDIPTRSLRDMESYVTQETWLFHDTIAANIEIGRPGAGREEIRRAAELASLDDFIAALPDGYDTMIGEQGDTLSGGERQRIGVARAFLHDAPFLLLDEPTSNLDSLNEAIILKSLREEGKNRTIVLVSHRKSTLRQVDQIFEMKKGRVS